MTPFSEGCPANQARLRKLRDRRTCVDQSIPLAVSSRIKPGNQYGAGAGSDYFGFLD